jgi:hypothetical protein
MTLVLAGQPKMGRMLEDTRRKNFFQRIGIYARLKPLKSPKVIKDYVEHRLQCAGCKRTVFSGSAFEALFQHTNGVPRLVNRVCKLAMKAAETNSLTEISDDLIHAISERFQKSSKKVLSSAGSKGRKAVEPAKASVNGLPAQVAPRVKTANGRHISHQKPTKSPQPVPHPVSVESSLQPLETKQNEQKDQVKLPSACHLPDEVLERLRSLADEKARQRLAGRLAAKEITSHPEKYQGAHSDPVRIWDELRTEILRLSA